jgi:hypothetical protein
MILRFDSLERREMLSGAGRKLPDLVGSKFYTTSTADLGDTIQAMGEIKNQGRATVRVPFHVDIFASSSTTAGRYAVKLAELTIPAGLARNQTIPFNTTVKLPSSALPGMGRSNTLYVSLKIDPEKAVRESNHQNDQGVGLGYDISTVTIAPHPSAKLQGSTLSLSSANTVWGSTLTVTAQVQNNGAGAAPATRARLVLTPVGALQGGPSDVTIANLEIPAIDPHQSANLVQQVTLPTIPPSDLTGSTSFALSLVDDADYITNQAYPHVVTQGINLDQVAIKILPADGTNPPVGPLADLAVSTISPSADTLTWGKPLQVTTTIQNIGSADAGQFRVFFVLVGATGSVNDGIFLGQAVIPGLRAGFDQTIVQSLQLPARIPQGLSLNNVGKARIAVVADPENVVDETVSTNNTTDSASLVLRVVNPGEKATPAHRSRTLARARKPRKLYHKAPPKSDSFLHKLSVFPKDLGNVIKKYI